jgi:hypothetical protein
MLRFPTIHDDLPAGPPPEVLHEIDIAWGRAQDLFDSDLELHFEIDERFGEVWAELRSFDGSFAERLTASEALDIACGDARVELPVAA